MWIRKLFDSLKPARSRTPVRPAHGRLSVETLEDRPDVEREFQAGVVWLRVGLAVVLIAAFATAAAVGALKTLG